VVPLTRAGRCDRVLCGASDSEQSHFGPSRDSILLVAGDKAGRWQEWYREAIPLAELRYERYLKERVDEEGRPR
jgi:hypothetical protein